MNSTKENESRWDELVRAGVPCGKPQLKLTPRKAQRWLDEEKIFGDIKGKNVLCLASGGGQQSIGFALLGAKVTVVDFSSEQLKKDKEVAEKFSKDIRIVKADMRDLSAFKDKEFDIVYQPYSINYIPKTDRIFSEVSRVIKKGGVYHLMFHNPFVHGTWKDGCWGNRWRKEDLWNGKGYPLWQSYKDGQPIKTSDPNWNFANRKGKNVKVKSPQEYKHTLSTILNSLTIRDFHLLKFKEHTGNKFDSKPGTWDHYISIAPPWFYIWVEKS